MPTFALEKLVRDELPRLYEEDGQIAELRILEGDELRHAYSQKLVEERRELQAEVTDRQAILGEIADVQEVIDCMHASGISEAETEEAQAEVNALLVQYRITAEELVEKQAQKNAKVGSFMRGMYIVRLTVQEDSEWADYYRERNYPEVA